MMTLVVRNYTGMTEEERELLDEHRRRRAGGERGTQVEPARESEPPPPRPPLSLPEQKIDAVAVAAEPEKSEEEWLDELEAHLEREMKPEPETWSIARPWETERQTRALTDD